MSRSRPIRSRLRSQGDSSKFLRQQQEFTAHAILGLAHPHGFLGYAIERAMKEGRAARWKALAKKLWRERQR